MNHLIYTTHTSYLPANRCQLHTKSVALAKQQWVIIDAHILFPVPPPVYDKREESSVVVDGVPARSQQFVDKCLKNRQLLAIFLNFSENWLRSLHQGLETEEGCHE